MRFEFAYALRRLLRAPTYSILGILSLAVGMAGVIALSAVVDTLLLREPPGVRAPEEVVAIGPWTGKRRLSYPDYVDMAGGMPALESMGAFAITDYTIRVGTESRLVRGMLGTSSLGRTLGAPLRGGRWFSDDEDQIGAPPVALVSVDLALSAFGGNALGSTLTLGGRSFHVVGVLDDAVAPDMSPIDVVVPIQNAPAFGGAAALTSRDYQWIRVVGRLKHTSTAAAASVQATEIYRRSNVGVRSVDQASLARAVIQAQSLIMARRDPDAKSAAVSVWLAGLAAVLLIVVCVNFAGLALARNLGDRRAIATHAALGATPLRLAARLGFESTLISLSAALLAVLIAYVVNDQITSQLIEQRVAPDIMAGRSLVMIAAVTAFVILSTALPPVVRAMRVHPARDLAAAVGSLTRSRKNAFRYILGAQIALGVVLVSEATLFGTSLSNAIQVPLGIDVNRILVATVDLKAAGLSPDEARDIMTAIVTRTRALAGVDGTGWTNAAGAPGFLTIPVSVAGVERSATLSVSAVTPGYLEALGLRIISGRTLQDGDLIAGNHVAVVSKQFVESVLGDRDPLGKCVYLAKTPTGECDVIVGVASNRRSSPTAAMEALEVFVPLAKNAFPEQLRAAFPGRELVIHTRGGTADVAAQVREIILSAEPRLTAIRIATGRQYIGHEFESWRLGAAILGAFGVLAVVLAGFGTYGISTHTFAQRRKEFGIRAAIGADPTRLGTAILIESVVIASIGILTGTVVSSLLVHLTKAMTFGIATLDLALVFVAPLILLLVTAIATLPAAWRAARIAPARVLTAG